MFDFLRGSLRAKSKLKYKKRLHIFESLIFVVGDYVRKQPLFLENTKNG